MTITYANNFFLELMKYDEIDLIGQDYRKLFHNEMPRAIIEEQTSIIQNGNKWQAGL